MDKEIRDAQTQMKNRWQIGGSLEISENRLHIDGIDAPSLASEFGTPLFVFSESRIRHNIARIRQARELIGRPLKVCYAAKANSTMGILRTVLEAGCDIEVNSGGELWKALKIGFRGDQIIFNGTSKELWEIENAIDAGIYAIQVDSLYELSLIEEAAMRLRKRANVSLRLVPEIETKTHSGLQTALLTSKFGMMPSEAFEAFRRYKNSPHLDLAGIHLHIGSQNPEPSVYAEAFVMLFETLVKAFEETGVRLRHINVGGGFPVNYLSRMSGELPITGKQSQMLAADFDPAEAIRNAWQAVDSKAEVSGSLHLLKDVELLTEPGRRIIGDAGICLTSVRNKKTRPINPAAPGTAALDSPIETWLLTDAGFNILLSMETYKWYYDLISASRAGEGHTMPYKVAGPLCDGGDVYFDIEGSGRLPDHRLLPENTEPGEILALLNCGAYSLAQASQYNGRFLPAVILIRENGTAELIRRRDKFDDLIANDVF
jgi:diaminopimelate decarboxylase